MSLYVKYPILSKTCRNKKSNGAAAAAATVYITPPNSSLSSSSGSLSSISQSSFERKRSQQHTRGKYRRYKGHSMLIVPLPKRKKLKTMKKTNSSSSPSTSSGNESDVSLERTKVDSPDSENYDDLVFSSCKELFNLREWRDGHVVRHFNPHIYKLCALLMFSFRFCNDVYVVF